MDARKAKMIQTVLNTLGVIVLLAAAFDVVEFADDTMIFAALVCFIVAGLAGKALK